MKYLFYNILYLLLINILFQLTNGYTIQGLSKKGLELVIKYYDYKINELLTLYRHQYSKNTIYNRTKYHNSKDICINIETLNYRINDYEELTLCYDVLEYVDDIVNMKNNETEIFNKALDLESKCIEIAYYNH